MLYLLEQPSDMCNQAKIRAIEKTYLPVVLYIRIDILRQKDLSYILV